MTGIQLQIHQWMHIALATSLDGCHAAHAGADDVMLLVQISQNPKLTKLNLPLLEAIGGPLIIQNNSALATLESLEHLAAVNATGKIPSITIPGLQVPCPCLLVSRDILAQACR